MRSKSRWLFDLMLSLIGGLVLGAVVGVFSAGSFWQGWLAASLLSFVSLFLLIRLWRKFGSSRLLAILIALTFLLRIAVGIFIYQVLPSAGYDTEVQNAGYLYSDAYNRDQMAVHLASGEDSLFMAFTNPEKVDQYGGLLFFTSAIYRFLSPETARPLLITLLAAFAMAAGVAFLYSAIQKRWNKRVAAVAAWIFALYPDSILLGSSQMREPFLISLACIGFWAILQWREKPLKAVVITAISLATTCLFSVPAGCITAAILGAILILEWSLLQEKDCKKIIGLAVLTGLGVISMVAGWMWLKDTLYYDAYTTTQGSGWITALLEQYGDKWTLPFVTIYGLTQPLFPAAIFEPSLPFWVTIAILRGLGWYLALPLLLFGFFASWKAEKNESKWILVLLFSFFFLWVVVSSARAGGDLWDNPRYRLILLPFMSLIIAWAVEHYRHTRSPWLWRWVAVIGVFVLFYTNFYARRYMFPTLPYFGFLPMNLFIGVISGVILIGGVIWDRIVKRLKAK